MREMYSVATNQQFILNILNSLTDDYERQIENLEEKLDSDDLSIEDLAYFALTAKRRDTRRLKQITVVGVIK